MNALGINQGTSGNVSARVDGGMLITPSGVPYEELTPYDIVSMELDGTWSGVEGRKPSSEWPFHLSIYKARPDAGGIVHTHAMHATALSMHRMDVPACHYMIGFAGGPSIRCAAYATFGTQQLSDNALVALEGRRACLLANHGMIVFWDSVPRALWLAGEVETLCAQYWRALQIGTPAILSDEEMDTIIEKFGSGYGLQAQGGGGSPARAAKPRKAAAKDVTGKKVAGKEITGKKVTGKAPGKASGKTKTKPALPKRKSRGKQG